MSKGTGTKQQVGAQSEEGRALLELALVAAEDKDDGVRIAACDAIISALRWTEREEKIWRLGGACTEAMCLMLTAWHREKNEQVRRRISDVIDAMSSAFFSFLDRRMVDEVVRQIWEELDSDGRKYVLGIIPYIASKGIIDLVSEGLRDPDNGVRVAAVGAAEKLMLR